MGPTRWFAPLAVLGSIVIGIVAYNAGVSQGAAEAAAASGTVPPYVYWGWHRPWGFGFGFPIFFFLLFWFVFARGFFWGGPWRRGCSYDRPRADADRADRG